MSNFFQKVIKSPSTSNLINSFSNNEPLSKSESHSNSGTINSTNTAVETPTLGESGGLEQSPQQTLIRSESSVSILSNSSTGSDQRNSIGSSTTITNNNNNKDQELTRQSSNTSMRSDDSSSLGSMSPTQTLDIGDEIDALPSISSSTSSSTSSTPNHHDNPHKKLTRKIAQFMSSSKLPVSTPSTPNHQQDLSPYSSPMTASVESSPSITASQATTSNHHMFKKLLRAPELFKSSKHTDADGNVVHHQSKHKKKKEEKRKARMEMFEISTPYNVIHKMHVDFDLKWTGHTDFKLDEKLGDGAYGSVYKGTHKDMGFTLAIKVVGVKQSEAQSLQNEIDILKNCKSPNVVSYYGSLTHQDNIWILMDFCALGSIRDIIESTEKTLNESQISFVVKNTLKGLIYLHSQNIIHRDVKAANILLSENCDVKIADFGVSEKLNSSFDQSKEMIGTPLWMAPEVILKKSYDYKADVWSLGITIIEMADGLPPHMDMNPMRAMKMVPIWPPPTFKDPKQWSPLLNDFLAKCLCKDPEKRASPTELLNHPFLKKDKSPDVLGDLVNQLFRIKKKKYDEQKKQNLKQSSSKQDLNESEATHHDGQSTLQDEDKTENLLSTAGGGTMLFKGSYTTCQDFDDEDDEEEDDEDVDEEDQDVDPFSTTVFHKNGSMEDSLQNDEEDEDDEEISATGTMVVKKPYSHNRYASQPSHSIPSKPLPSLPLYLQKSTSGSNISEDSIKSEFQNFEQKMLSFIDTTNQTTVQDIKLQMKTMESNILTYIDQEITKVTTSFQSNLLPIMNLLEEIKNNQQKHSTSPNTKVPPPVAPRSNINNNNSNYNNNNKQPSSPGPTQHSFRPLSAPAIHDQNIPDKSYFTRSSVPIMGGQTKTSTHDNVISTSPKPIPAILKRMGSGKFNSPLSSSPSSNPSSPSSSLSSSCELMIPSDSSNIDPEKHLVKVKVKMFENV
ncbi:hypothetical protein CYY_006472 [Polysphondylium violaceum]|uniref:non-specific serine/threonine protein kinase n=1 Tax=Polysphondylium violaceum TaxID=133409 RepID=A0A8J4PZS8_9MYCE|nr:hypothetical protein CYY_006472 [Polysphondylium violaceum]